MFGIADIVHFGHSLFTPLRSGSFVHFFWHRWIRLKRHGRTCSVIRKSVCYRKFLSFSSELGFIKALWETYHFWKQGFSVHLEKMPCLLPSLWKLSFRCLVFQGFSEPTAVHQKPVRIVYHDQIALTIYWWLSTLYFHSSFTCRTFAGCCNSSMTDPGRGCGLTDPGRGCGL